MSRFCFNGITCLTHCRYVVKENFGIRVNSLSSCHGMKLHDRIPAGNDDGSVRKEIIERIIPKDTDERNRLLKAKPLQQPPDSRILKATIIGLPNAGKSTLTNALLNWRVSSVSSKVHTTLHNSKAIITEGNTQIVLLDTPGIVSRSEKKRYELSDRMVSDQGKSIQLSDLIIVLLDVSIAELPYVISKKMLNTLEPHNDKSKILVLNKVDKLKSRSKLEKIVKRIYKREDCGIKPQNYSSNVIVMDSYREPKEYIIPEFQEVFAISATEREGVDQLKEYLLNQARRGDWLHDSALVTDEAPHSIVTLAVREKFLDHLPAEIPYSLKLQIESWETDENDILKIIMSVKCQNKRHMKLVIGNAGKVIHAVAQEARQELMNTFRADISLKLIVS